MLPTSSRMDGESLKKLARETLTIEAKAIMDLADGIDENLTSAVELILNTSGKLIVTGMGKSGNIGMKAAATFASTGTPSFFMHPGEAFHGDLGMIGEEDTILMLSYSGETDETLRLIPFLRENGNRVISMTGNPASTLGKNSDTHICVHIEKEACPLDLAPTTSTTATLAMCDALAVVLMQARNFQPENFARLHPGGSLGRRLLTRVRDLMREQELPWINENDSIETILHTISAGRLGLALVHTATQGVCIITDGDIRRVMSARQDHFFGLQAKDLMTVSPKKIGLDARLTEAADVMNEHKIGSLLVVDEQEVVGVIQVYDLKL